MEQYDGSMNSKVIYSICSEVLFCTGCLTTEKYLATVAFVESCPFVSVKQDVKYNCLLDIFQEPTNGKPCLYSA